MNKLASIYSSAVGMLALCGFMAFEFSRMVPDNLAAITAHGVSFWPVAWLILIGSGGATMLWSAIIVGVEVFTELRTSEDR
ncbi:hypothetical protein BH10ACT4_BH10ACT4_12720 [soil metagenome]|uniref:hypothetical protein n=1 Tax=Glaciihabitans sp. INWT7 TaxID=2596912 RepID=UPI00162425E7|nr:hypothetical protein [Glaciihabitans sp. INWT7]QNE46308.1 hypothetical protein F1C58_04885 [Glaciihabitans sp. INWT7]